MAKAHKLNKQAILKQLHSEFKKLERGEDITLTIRVKPKAYVFKHRLRVCWLEDTHSTIRASNGRGLMAVEDQDLGVFEECYYDALDESKKEHIERHNAAIVAYIAKCDRYAAQFKQNKDDFWMEVYDFDTKKGTRR